MGGQSSCCSRGLLLGACSSREEGMGRDQRPRCSSNFSPAGMMICGITDLPRIPSRDSTLEISPRGLDLGFYPPYWTKAVHSMNCFEGSLGGTS